MEEAGIKIRTFPLMDYINIMFRLRFGTENQSYSLKTNHFRMKRVDYMDSVNTTSIIGSVNGVRRAGLIWCKQDSTCDQMCESSQCVPMILTLSLI